MNQNFNTFEAKAKSMFEKLFSGQQAILKTLQKMSDEVNNVINLKQNNTTLAIQKSELASKPDVVLLETTPENRSATKRHSSET